MKKLRTSFIVKMIAWMLIAISGLGMVGSGAAVGFMLNQGMYNRTLEDVREEHYGRYSDRYSALALDHFLNNKESGIEYFENKNFKYGIMKADSDKELESLDLSKEEIFLETNFEGEVPELEKLHVFQCSIKDETFFDYHNPESLFGYYWIRNTDRFSASYAIDGFVYDYASGVFYCEANGFLYPIPNVLLHLNDEYAYEAVSLTYDGKQGGYRVKEGSDFQMSENTNISVLEVYCYDIDVEAYMALLLSKPIFDFSMAEEIGIYADSWDEINISNYRGKDWANVLESRSEWVDLRYEDYDENADWIVKDKIVRIDAAGYVNIQSQNSTSNNYIVVSYVSSPLVTNGEEWIYGDLFVKFEYLYNSLYQLRYEAIGIAFGCLLVYVMVFVLLCYMAGYRKGQEGLSESFINKVPLEIYATVTITVEVVGLMLLENVILYSSSANVIFIISVAAGLILILGLLLTAMMLELITRIKLRTLWKRTICAWLIEKIFGSSKRFLRFIYENISLVVRVLLCAVILFAIDFILIALINGGEGFALLLFLVGRVALLAAIIAVAFWLSKLKVAGEHVAAGDLNYKVDTSKMLWDFKQHGEHLNSIGDGLSVAVEERMKSEHFKTELITNVSHDIKTPLTSIINYVDLLQKEEIESENATEYIEVLARQSARLKKLLEDLLEASKASTGTLPVEFEVLEAGVFMVQTVGEFEEKTKAADLELIIKKPEEPIYIKADGRHFWRVIDNLMNNICKYAQPNTRVYINLEATEKEVSITFRNTSRYALNITSEELMERFVRGDASRNTEGSGLGLSIAQSLMELMHARFELVVDGDLFKVILIFARQENVL